VSEANFRDMFETVDVFGLVWQGLEYFMWNDYWANTEPKFAFNFVLLLCF